MSWCVFTYLIGWLDAGGEKEQVLTTKGKHIAVAKSRKGEWKCIVLDSSS